MDIRKLVKLYPSLFVSRRVDGERRVLVRRINGLPFLLDEAFHGISVDDFSVNIVGGRFIPRKHIKYRPVDKTITASWDGSPILCPQEGMYEEKRPCFSVFYSVRQFYNFPLKQEMFFQKEKDFLGYVGKLSKNKQEQVYIKKFSAKESLSLPVKKCIDHRPTRCNYWHMTFNVFAFEDDDNPIQSETASKSQRRVLSHLKSDFLTKQIKLFVVQPSILSCFYRRGKVNDFILRVIGLLFGPSCVM